MCVLSVVQQHVGLLFCLSCGLDPLQLVSALCTLVIMCSVHFKKNVDYSSLLGWSQCCASLHFVWDHVTARNTLSSIFCATTNEIQKAFVLTMLNKQSPVLLTLSASASEE